MEGEILMFWQAGPHVQLAPAEICRELVWGEEVEGLIDLPVRDIIDRLRAAFPRHEEQSGQLIGHSASGSFEATWTWQFVKVTCHDLEEESRELIAQAVGFAPYDPEREGGKR